MYECTCGWHYEHQSGGYREPGDVVSAIESKLDERIHPRAKRAWQQLFIQPLLIQERERPKPVQFNIPSFLQSRRKNAGDSGQAALSVDKRHVCESRLLGACSYCRMVTEHYAVYSSNGHELMHPILCEACGEDIKVFEDFTSISCPICDENVIAVEIKLIPADVLSRRTLSLHQQLENECVNPRYIGMAKRLLLLLSRFENVPLAEDSVSDWAGAAVKVIALHDLRNQGKLDENKESSPKLEEKICLIEEILDHLGISNMFIHHSDTVVFAVGEEGIRVSNSLIPIYLNKYVFAAVEWSETNVGFSVDGLVLIPKIEKVDPSLISPEQWGKNQWLKYILPAKHMVLLVGAGSGLGESAIVISKIARYFGLFTSAVTGRPLPLEGRERQQRANKLIGRLAAAVDSLHVVPQPLHTDEADKISELLHRRDEMLLKGFKTLLPYLPEEQA
ncbi:hypothetical protein [Paenibacillus agricola]|nr:hypothetical protein [Paenibacillus agricola]